MPQGEVPPHKSVPHWPRKTSATAHQEKWIQKSMHHWSCNNYGVEPWEVFLAFANMIQIVTCFTGCPQTYFTIILDSLRTKMHAFALWVTPMWSLLQCGWNSVKQTVMRPRKECLVNESAVYNIIHAFSTMSHSALDPFTV